MTIFRCWCLNKPNCETSIFFFFNGYFWKHLFLRFTDIILNKFFVFPTNHWWSLSHSCHISVLTRWCKLDTFLICHATESFISNLNFFKCFLYQHGDTCQQCQKPFMIHLFNVKYGGVLLRGACESRPPSYFLISCMPTTRLCHHIVISCSEMK